MPKVGVNKAGECYGKIMSLEAGQADRSEMGASVPRAAESSSMQKNSARYSRPVSSGQVNAVNVSMDYLIRNVR